VAPPYHHCCRRHHHCHHQNYHRHHRYQHPSPLIQSLLSFASMYRSLVAIGRT
jgi:hypothetical protein